MSGRPVDGENESLLAGPAVCPHPHHPSAYGHDRQVVFCHGDEMRKYLSVSVTVAATPGRVVILALFVPQLDADDAKVTFEEEPGKDVYDECPLP